LDNPTSAAATVNPPLEATARCNASKLQFGQAADARAILAPQKFLYLVAERFRGVVGDQKDGIDMVKYCFYSKRFFAFFPFEASNCGIWSKLLNFSEEFFHDKTPLKNS